MRVRLIERLPRSTSRVWVFNTRSLKERLCAEGSVESATVPARRTRARSRAKQLIQRERLRQIVVAAGVEAIDPITYRVTGGEYQDRYVIPRRAEHPRRFQAVKPRHHHVHDHRIRPECGEPGERLHAVFGGAHLVAVVFQGTLQRVADGLIIIDDQDMHAPSVPDVRPIELASRPELV